jgi:hypothetical protein
MATILGSPELASWPLSAAELELARRPVEGFGSLASEARERASGPLRRRPPGGVEAGGRGQPAGDAGMARAELWVRSAEGWRPVSPDEWKWVRELAAHRLDRLLGFDLVPTTVARALGPEGVGALQEWVEGRRGGASQHRSSYYEIPDRSRQQLAVLDYAIANPDRTVENLILRPDGRPAAIDHGDAFPARAEDQRLSSDFVAERLGLRLAPEVLEAVRRLDLGEVYRMLRATGLGHEAAEGVLARLREIRERGRITGEAWPGAIVSSRGLVRRPRG